MDNVVRAPTGSYIDSKEETRAMTVESVTVRVPRELYTRLQERAQRTQRSVEDELVEALMGSIVIDDEPLPADVAAALAPLETLPDDALWEVARSSRLSPAAAAHLEDLNDRRQREGLTVDEQRMAETLLHQYERAMLVRADALARLQERGRDVSALLEPLTR